MSERRADHKIVAAIAVEVARRNGDAERVASLVDIEASLTPTSSASTTRQCRVLNALSEVARARAERVANLHARVILDREAV